jgi:hypothetical protein
MPKHVKKTMRRKTRRVKRTRRVMPRRKYSGGYDPMKDNTSYPTKMNGYPVGQSGALPDPSGHGESPRWF